MPDATRPPRRARTSHLATPLAVLAATLCFVFDLATILPAAAAGYAVKRALGVDVVRGVDVLPDALIEGGLAALARGIRDGR